jgi:CRISPR-associated endonuclease Csn1
MPQRGRVLGIDLGSNSLGTALIDTDSQTVPFLGVRIFPASTEGDRDKGKEESKAKPRREARLARRQTKRRKHRLQKVFRLLQGMGLLPPGSRPDALPALQRELQRRYPETTVLPYFLRARALDHPLHPNELGRALYHLAQRRGFLSNRATAAKEEEDKSAVKSAIKSLREDIATSGKRTLGEFMASLDPHQIPIRNKGEFHAHYTHRSMYEDEFERMWAAQAPHHPTALKDVNKAKLRYALFHQRPLKDQSHLVGICELEPSQKRAPLRCLAAQRLRVLGFVNNLRIRLEDGNEARLTPAQRATLLDLTEESEKLTFAKVRRDLNIPKPLVFTIEKGGEKNVPVDLTSTRLRSVLGALWDDLSPAQRDDLVEDVGDRNRCKTDKDLQACAIEKWGLSPETAEKLAYVRLPPDYALFSARALERLLPHLEQGKSVTEAILAIPEYAERQKAAEPLDLLPPVKKVLGDIRNPAVLRALTELRKTVNAILRRFGKPEYIRIELARDLKKSKKDRLRAVDFNRKRENLREQAKAELSKHDPARFRNPRPSDIEKYLLAMEAGWCCPYTDRHYEFTDVFGDHPQVDIEHIVPRSRCLDNSFLNKVLAYRSANIEKGNLTPYEWLHDSDPDRYERMIAVVKKFDSLFQKGKKLRRFSMQLSDPDSLLTEFSQRQLQETRYASKLACKYLGLLYGGEIDAGGTRRVSATGGQITSMLRRAWDLNLILNPHPLSGSEKIRVDHRHHAIDALTIALASPAIVRALATASAEADRLGRRTIVVPVPFNRLADKVRERIETLQVSHRPTRKLSGALHDETLYSRPRVYAANGDKKSKEYVHYRVPITKLTSVDKIADIVDPTVRKCVLAQFERLGGGGTKFQNNWPILKTRKGGEVPVKRVRIRRVQKVKAIGKGLRERFVIPGSNHHAEIVAEINSRGEIKRYRSEAITLLEAAERKRQGVPVVNRDDGSRGLFVCTLSEGDLIEARKPGDVASLIWRVCSVRQSGQLDLTRANDARLKKDIAGSKGLWRPTIASIFSGGARKVLITHLGEVLPAND